MALFEVYRFQETNSLKLVSQSYIHTVKHAVALQTLSRSLCLAENTVQLTLNQNISTFKPGNIPVSLALDQKSSLAREQYVPLCMF